MDKYIQFEISKPVLVSSNIGFIIVHGLLESHITAYIDIQSPHDGSDETAPDAGIRQVTVELDTVGGHYNAGNSLQTPNNRHPIAHPRGPDMGCLLWVQTLIYVLL